MDEPDQTDRYQAMEACEPNPVGCMLVLGLVRRETALKQSR